MLVVLALALTTSPPVSATLTQDAHVVGARAAAPPAVTAGSSAGLVGTLPSIEVLLANIPGAARNMVPGLAGVPFDPGIGTSHFDRVYGHPSGRWVLTALADLAPTEDEVLIVDGALVIRESDPAPWASGSEACGTLDQRCAVNVHGDVVFATNSSASANDDYIVTLVGNQWAYVAREGDPILGLPGTTFDDRIESPLILDDGRVGCEADGIDGTVTFAEDNVLLLGNLVLAQKGVTVPPGQAASTPSAIEDFDLGDFWTSSDGLHWIVQGDLDGAQNSDDVVLVDGGVVLQEGVVIPASGVVEPIGSDGLFGVSMDVTGNWFARGDFEGSGDDWVVRNGAIVARTGAPITPGDTEVWDDSRYSRGFFAHVGNGLGNWIVAGTTDHPDPALDSVAILDGHVVVARESDPVDLDGDGLPNDGIFLDAFGTDDFFLSNDLDLLVVATLKDASGLRVGQGLIRIEIDPGVGVQYCDGALNSTGHAGRLMALGSPVIAVGDLRLRASRLPQASNAMFFVSRTPGFIPNVGGSLGTMCISGMVARFLGPGEFGQADPSGTFELQVDLTSIPQPMGAVVGLPGDVWHFQCWYRDFDPAGAATTNFSDAVAVTLQ